jgi:hypothetical protein
MLHSISKGFANTQILVNSVGFSQWCVAVTILEFLDFIHHQVFIRLLKNTVFQELDLFLSCLTPEDGNIQFPKRCVL